MFKQADESGAEVPFRVRYFTQPMYGLVVQPTEVEKA
jgi:hypothetical protein